MANRKRSTNSFYSYSAKRSLRQEEVSAYRRITLATLLVIALIVGGYFLGVPLLANLGNGSSDDQITPLGSADNVAPAAPRLNSQPDQVNTRSLNVSGTAESGSTVTVYINDKEAFSALTDKDGQFSGEAQLEGGKNTVTAIAQDAAGNKSRQSKSTEIVYDATPPSLVLLQEISSQTDKQELTVKGKTESSAKVTINQRQAVVASDGVFSQVIQLDSGENRIEIIAKDMADNSRKIERSITYSGESDETAAESN